MATTTKKTRGAGRPKGSQNKVTTDIKEMILAALNKAGGLAYMTEQAKKNPTAFLTLLGKILPTQVTGEDGGPIIVQLSDVDSRL